MARIISNNEIEYQVDEGGNEESREEGEAAARNRMKKGPWTPYEDSILMDYVSRYGEGNWNSVQKNSGLSRCGKSCRLRWANHLRPNLKKGAFSDEEEDIIIQLHSKLGNKWAQMAAQLPGRTDNEIKNFWNTRLKRRQRAGLPIYPPQVQDNEEKQPNFSTSSSPSFSMLLASCYPKKPDEPTHFSSLIPLPTPPDKNDNHACYTNPGSGNKNANLVLPLSPYYGSSSSSSTNFFFNNQSGPATNFTIPLALGSKSTEVSSSQSPPGSATPGSSSSGMGSAALLSPQGNNSGLLDAVVIEAQGLSRNNDKSKCDEDSTFARKKSSHKRKSIIELEEEYGGNKEESLTALLFESTSKSTADTTTQTQTGKKVGGGGEEALVNCYWGMDDDLFSLLNNFPSQTPTPEWYRRGGGSSTNHQSLGLESQAAAGSGPITADFAWTLATPDHAWMPGLC